MEKKLHRWRELKHFSVASLSTLLTYEDRLKALRLHSLEKTRLVGELVTVFKYLTGGCMENRGRPCSVADRNKTRKNGFTLEQGKF